MNGKHTDGGRIASPALQQAIALLQMMQPIRMEGELRRLHCSKGLYIQRTPADRWQL
ncbi:MAG: hypothetical protein J7466_19970 [Roseiflexus sp.]|nr:hypothetical protein [Roseiflexus sp.]